MRLGIGLHINRIQRAFSTRFITEFTVGAGESITLPLISTGSYNFTVDYGDNTGIKEVTAYNDVDRIHDYTAAGAGTYTVVIEGICDRWNFFSVATSKDKLTKIISLGDVGWITMQNAFRSCINLTSVDNGGIYLSSVADFSTMFYQCTSLVSLLAIFDVSGGTNFSNMFGQCTHLISLPAIFDVSSGANFANMFYGCTNLISLPAIFNISGGTNFINMLYYCTSLISLPAIFNISGGTNFKNMFGQCTNLISLPAIFDVSGGTNFLNMFSGCTSLVSLPAIFDVSSGANFANMFSGCTSLISLPAIFDVSGGINFTYMFYQCTNLVSLPAIFDVSSGADFTGMFLGCTSLSGGTVLGCSVSVSFSNCNFDAAGLDAIYTDLATATATITVTGNPGISGDNPSIATAKNWTVTGS